MSKGRICTYSMSFASVAFFSCWCQASKVEGLEREADLLWKDLEGGSLHSIFVLHTFGTTKH